MVRKNKFNKIVKELRGAIRKREQTEESVDDISNSLFNPDESTLDSNEFSEPTLPGTSGTPMSGDVYTDGERQSNLVADDNSISSKESVYKNIEVDDLKEVLENYRNHSDKKLIAEAETKKKGVEKKGTDKADSKTNKDEAKKNSPEKKKKRGDRGNNTEKGDNKSRKKKSSNNDKKPSKSNARKKKKTTGENKASAKNDATNKRKPRAKEPQGVEEHKANENESKNPKVINASIILSKAFKNMLSKKNQKADKSTLHNESLFEKESDIDSFSSLSFKGSDSGSLYKSDDSYKSDYSSDRGSENSYDKIEARLEEFNKELQKQKDKYREVAKPKLKDPQIYATSKTGDQT